MQLLTGVCEYGEADVDTDESQDDFESDVMTKTAHVKKQHDTVSVTV